MHEDQTCSRVVTGVSLSAAVKYVHQVLPGWGARDPSKPRVTIGSPRPATLPLWEPEVVSFTFFLRQIRKP